MKLPTDKAELRKAMRKLRRRLSEQSGGGQLAVAQVLARRGVPKPRGLPLFHRPIVGLYYANGWEIRTDFLADLFRRKRWRQAYPVVLEPDRPMVFRELQRNRNLERDALGLVVPSADAPVVEPDLLIVPMLAFDRKGHRLGQGGGYYDRTIANLRAVKPVFVLGLAYAGQEVEELPAEPHDERLDAILTETGYIEVR